MAERKKKDEEMGNNNRLKKSRLKLRMANLGKSRWIDDGLLKIQCNIPTWLLVLNRPLIVVIIFFDHLCDKDKLRVEYMYIHKQAKFEATKYE